MAIYHLHTTIGKRQNGQSASAKVMYNSRTFKYKQQKQKADHIASGNMPKWAEDDPLLYWKSADRYERANGKLYHQIEFSLPVEIDFQSKIKVSENFAKRVSEQINDIDGKLPYHLVIHDADGHNPHCHLLLSERANDNIDRTEETWFKRFNPSDPSLGGAKKTRDLQPKQWLLNVREAWAEYANEALANNGYDIKIDHRSYAKQGINKIPSTHVGPVVKVISENDENENDLERIRIHNANEKYKKNLIQMEHEMKNLAKIFTNINVNRSESAALKQMMALKCLEFEIGIFDRTNDKMERRILDQNYIKDYKKLQKFFKFLRYKNINGHDIFIKPLAKNDDAIILLDDIDQMILYDLKEDGFQPSCIIETSPENFQCWLNFGQTIDKHERSLLAKYFAKIYDADVGAATHSQYGRLVGFTNRKSKYETKDGFPFVKLIEINNDVINKSIVDLVKKAQDMFPKKELKFDKKNTGISGINPKDFFLREYKKSIQYLHDNQFLSRNNGKIDYSSIDFFVAKKMYQKGFNDEQIYNGLLESPKL